MYHQFSPSFILRAETQMLRENSKKMRNSNSQQKREKSSEKENHFDHLPDDLIVSQILDKSFDAKSLCSISILSRRFSALIQQTQVISVKIALSPALPSGEVLDLETAAKFLAGFRSIKFLCVELDYSLNLTGKDVDPLVVKWRINSESTSFMILTARNLVLATSKDYNEQGISTVNRVASNLLRRFFNSCMKMACGWFKFVETLVQELPESLQKVVVVDSNREGKVHFGGRDIIRMRNGNSNFGAGEANIRVWNLPFLKLPVSSCGMKMVTLFISKGTEKIDHDDLLIAKEAFDGEDDQQVYKEAVLEMLKRDFGSQEIVPAQDFSFRLSFD